MRRNRHPLCALPHINIEDLAAWGTSNNAEGGVTINNGASLTNQQGGVRKGGGCQDNDHNGNDFDVLSGAALLPRNASSPVNPICGGSPRVLAISKTAPASVIVNQTFTYTLSVDNSLGVDATGVVITDSLPLSVTFSAASDGGALLPGNVISWTVPTLANGASISQTVSVVAPGTPVTLTNADYGVWASNWLTRSVGSPVDTTVSALPTNPTGVGAADPSAVVIGYTLPVLTVAVTPGSNPPSTGLAVTCDLSAIGGSATQALFDDGTHGDATSADNTFSYLASVASSTTSGAKNLPCTISDMQTAPPALRSGLLLTWRS